jgi:hypothetical protein
VASPGVTSVRPAAAFSDRRPDVPVLRMRDAVVIGPRFVFFNGSAGVFPHNLILSCCHWRCAVTAEGVFCKGPVNVSGPTLVYSMVGCSSFKTVT